MEEEEDGGEHDVLVEGEFDERGQSIVAVVSMDDQETAQESVVRERDMDRDI